MAVEGVTREDRQAFRLQLLSDIRALIGEGQPKSAREGLKNSEVRRLPKVSSNTVQRLRVAGKQKSTKLVACIITGWTTLNSCCKVAPNEAGCK